MSRGLDDQIAPDEASQQVVSISFTFTMRELYRCVLEHTLRQRAIQAMVVVVLALLVMGATSSPSILPTAMGCAGGLVVVVGVLPALGWRRNPALHSEQRYTFRPDGIDAAGANSRTELSWTAFVDLRSTQRAHYLRQAGKRFVVILPRRAFSPQAEQTFLALAGGKVKV
ncbi:MAG TPA: YcxB family protein [Acidimicrobiales bacterium]|jgi:hypothetical protein|nr:YcxB family protein [Acidimicrobiales bacterium]